MTGSDYRRRKKLDDKKRMPYLQYIDYITLSELKQGLFK